MEHTHPAGLHPRRQVNVPVHSLAFRLAQTHRTLLVQWRTVAARHALTGGDSRLQLDHGVGAHQTSVDVAAEHLAHRLDVGHVLRSHQVDEARAAHLDPLTGECGPIYQAGRAGRGHEESLLDFGQEVAMVVVFHAADCAARLVRLSGDITGDGRGVSGGADPAFHAGAAAAHPDGLRAAVGSGQRDRLGLSGLPVPGESLIPLAHQALPSRHHLPVDDDLVTQADRNVTDPLGLNARTRELVGGIQCSLGERLQRATAARGYLQGWPRISGHHQTGTPHSCELARTGNRHHVQRCAARDPRQIASAVTVAAADCRIGQCAQHWSVIEEVYIHRDVGVVTRDMAAGPYRSESVPNGANIRCADCELIPGLSGDVGTLLPSPVRAIAFSPELVIFGVVRMPLRQSDISIRGSHRASYIIAKLNFQLSDPQVLRRGRHAFHIAAGATCDADQVGAAQVLAGQSFHVAAGAAGHAAGHRF